MDYEKVHKAAIELGKKLIEKNPELSSWVQSVLPELKESEDERIRKGLLEIFRSHYNRNWYGLKVTDVIAYLEKQKEQKPIPKFKVGDRIYDKRDSYNRNVIKEVGKGYYINAFAQKMDMAYTDANFEFLEHLENDCIDSKPTEWSEEDESHLDYLIDFCNRYYNGNTPILEEGIARRLSNWLYRIKSGEISLPKQEWSEKDEGTIHLACEFIRHHSKKGDSIGGIDCNELVKMLKSLRPQPHWKPSEEQMEALKEATNQYWEPDGLHPLYTLYDDLKKL